MYIAEKLRKENVAEYLLYMWQVEDVVRAYGMDIERIGKEYVPQFGLDEEKSEELKGWYGRIIEMMREENVVERGHLQINKNVLILLTDLHVQLLKSSKHPFYSAAYYKALPFIVELRGKERKGGNGEREGKEGEKSEGKEGREGGQSGKTALHSGEEEDRAALGREEDENRTALDRGEEEKGESENGFEALYGVMMLRLQKKEISAETSAAVGSIARWIGMLSEYEKKEKKGEVEF